MRALRRLKVNPVLKISFDFSKLFFPSSYGNSLLIALTIPNLEI